LLILLEHPLSSYVQKVKIALREEARYVSRSESGAM